jgi:hypothetical protein
VTAKATCQPGEEGRVLEALLSACRHALETSSTPPEPHRVADPGSAERLVALAARHGVIPLLAVGLRRAGDELPEPAASDLRQREALNTRRALALAVEQRALLDDLRSAGVRALPFKGLDLAERHYGGAHRRGVGDLDLLVQAADLHQAAAVLRNRGYTATGSEPEGTREHHWSWRRAADRVDVELHFALRPSGLGPARPVRIGPGGHPSPGELLVLLAEHGAAHRWDRLKWLCDITALARNPAVVEDAWARSPELRGRRALLLALSLAQTHLGAPSVWRVASQRCPGWMPPLVTAIERGWPGTVAPCPSRLERWRFALAVTDRAGDRLAHALRLAGMLLVPSPQDREWAPRHLPRPLLPAARLVRLATRMRAARAAGVQEPVRRR